MFIFKGKFFKKARKEAGFHTIAALVGAMRDFGVTTTWTTIQQWEQVSAAPRSDLLMSAAAVLKCDPKNFFLFKPKNGEQNGKSNEGVADG